MQETGSFGRKSFIQGNKYYLIALTVIFADQIIKLVVKFNMVLYDEFRVFGDWFKITCVENKGAAFGLTIGDIAAKFGILISEDTSKLILSLFSISAIILIIYLLRKVSVYGGPLPVFMSLILGGALGNIVDRVFYGAWFAGMNNYDAALLHGRVVDMFHLDLGTLNLFGNRFDMLPVFNLADAAITVGIIAILIFQRRLFSLAEKGTAKPQNAENSQDQAVPEKETATDSPEIIEQEGQENGLI